jgi:hypothetical protein
MTACLEGSKSRYRLLWVIIVLQHTVNQSILLYMIKIDSLAPGVLLKSFEDNHVPYSAIDDLCISASPYRTTRDSLAALILVPQYGEHL